MPDENLTWLTPLLQCPVCGSDLKKSSDSYACDSSHRFPIVDGVPVLIDDERSVFSVSDFTDNEQTFYRENTTPFWRGAKKLAQRVVPDILENLKSKQNFDRLSALLQKREKPVILILGGGTLGVGMDDFIKVPDFHIIESDVAFAPHTAFIIDGHQIPLKDGSCDAVIAQGVLEHVIEAEQVVSEIHRVLKPNGIVYADTPFMQPGHYAPYDFRRYTAIGHRCLFRKFSMIDEGMSIGPAAAALWNLKTFIVSITPTRRGKSIASILVHGLFFLRYFDRLLINKRSVWDGASMFYFLGERSERTLTNRELIKLYS